MCIVSAMCTLLKVNLILSKCGMLRTSLSWGFAFDRGRHQEKSSTGPSFYGGPDMMNINSIIRDLQVNSIPILKHIWLETDSGFWPLKCRPLFSLFRGFSEAFSVASMLVRSLAQSVFGVPNRAGVNQCKYLVSYLSFLLPGTKITRRLAERLPRIEVAFLRSNSKIVFLPVQVLQQEPGAQALSVGPTSGFSACMTAPHICTVILLPALPGAAAAPVCHGYSYAAVDIFSLDVPGIGADAAAAAKTPILELGSGPGRPTEARVVVGRAKMYLVGNPFASEYGLGPLAHDGLQVRWLTYFRCLVMGKMGGLLLSEVLWSK